MFRFFETIRIQGGRAHHLAYHQHRMERTIRAVFGEQKMPLLEECVHSLPLGTFRCRVEYATIIERVEFIPYQIKIPRVFQIVESDIAYPYKSCDRSDIQTLFEKRGQADEIMICQEGEVRDTSVANLAFQIAGRWLTPKRALLPGTTRKRLLENGVVQEAPLKVADVRQAQSLAVMNAMVGFLEIPDFMIKE